MGVRRTAGYLALAAVLGVACSGDDTAASETASPSSSAPASTAERSPSDSETPVSGPDAAGEAADDGAGVLDEQLEEDAERRAADTLADECKFLAQIAVGADPTGSAEQDVGAGLASLAEEFREAAEVAPEGLAADLETLADAYAQAGQAFQTGDTQALGAIFQDGTVEQAANRVSTYVTDTCQPDGAASPSP